MTLIQMMLFTRANFRSVELATDFLRFLARSGGAFAPTHFDSHEPVRKHFDAHDLRLPATLLSGPPDHQYGGIFLKGAEYQALAWIKWTVGQVAQWYFQVSNTYFKRQSRVEEFVQFTAQLCREYPPLFGGAAAEEDWRAKHWRRLPTSGETESTEKIGLGLDGCLPGVYWLTVLGTRTVAELGANTLDAVSDVRKVDAGEGGIIVLLGDSPLAPAAEERLRRDDRLVGQLGREYFFDIREPERRCKVIPAVTSEEGSTSAPGGPIGDIPANGEFAVEEERRDVDEVAEDIVVFLHREIREVFAFSRESLAAIDRYFSQHSPTKEYQPAFLRQEFGPALGAYFGKVLVREKGARWQHREPVTDSTLSVAGRDVQPFKDAQAVIEGKATLLSRYDAIAAQAGSKQGQ